MSTPRHGHGVPRGTRAGSFIRPVVREAGDAALLAELPQRIDPMTNAAVLHLADRVRAAAIKGVRDVVPAIRSLAVFFDPMHTDVEALTRLLADRPLERDIAGEGRRHEVPVVYGGDAGPDVAEVAAASGLSRDDVIARHAGRDYRVYMLGFLPGFAYLGTIDPVLVAARRSIPRVKVPAGAVAAAGRQTGIYPLESPGGWAILGRTPMRMFDPGSSTPATFAPGDRVRFVPIPAADWQDPPAWAAEAATSASAPAVEIRRAGLMTTVQDTGRWGRQTDGVSVSGAMDRLAHRIANALVGNESSAATLEVTIAGPELVCLQSCVIAIAGADLSPQIAGQAVPRNQPLAVPAGATLSFGPRRTGARAYVAFAGGIDVPLVLGSRATHTASRIGGVAGRALRAGDRLSLSTRGPVPKKRPLPLVVGTTSGGAKVRVLPGPQADAFPAGALEKLTSTRFIVSGESNRMGYRLAGFPVPTPSGEMISDVTFPGALQIPPSGVPILLMADRQTTGGYPQLAVVISADMPAAAQLSPGDWIEFELTTKAMALGALAEQERTMQHFEGHAFA